MTRTAAREIAVRLIYAQSLTGAGTDELLENFFEGDHYGTLTDEDRLFAQRIDDAQKEYISALVRTVNEHSEELDGYLSKYASGWKPERISKTARAALRCAMCEILYMDDAPARAAINEAVELIKSYDDEETVSFVNGVLGGFMRGEMGESVPDEAAPAAEEAADVTEEAPVVTEDAPEAPAEAPETAESDA